MASALEASGTSNAEWTVAERRDFSAESMSQPATLALSSTAQEIMETLA
jgi:hypothetical protein